MWPDNESVICYIPHRFDWLSFRLPSFILLSLELSYFIIFVPFIFPREKAQYLLNSAQIPDWSLEP